MHPLLIALVGLAVVAIMTLAPLLQLQTPQTPHQASYWNGSLMMKFNVGKEKEIGSCFKNLDDQIVT